MFYIFTFKLTKRVSGFLLAEERIPQLRASEWYGKIVDILCLTLYCMNYDKCFEKILSAWNYIYLYVKFQLVWKSFVVPHPRVILDFVNLKQLYATWS